MPTDPVNPNTWVKYNNSVAVAAYMDGTAFIETSKERMQVVLNIANSFYSMMDIFINIKKCDLLVFNSPLPITANKVYLGDSHNGIIRVTSEEVRYLGVFLAAKGPDY
ncbi:unnamed protein product [Rhizophagus irregularis]|nr:unnamed protein product [Rhizophagus irregularis]CAB5360383.1 unnamed protein product [Rhizophagus irregularis]